MYLFHEGNLFGWLFLCRKSCVHLSFCVGKSNDLEGLARGIRIYFLHHALVKVVVKGRGQGTSIQDLVQTLEVIIPLFLNHERVNK